jgi:uncharacterized protein (TIGR03000 family)
MYSIVLMAAITTTPDTASFNGYFRDLFNRNGCNGCNGCSGGVRYGGAGCCGGTSYSASCSGCNGCNGCCGGSVFGWGLGDRVRRWFETAGSGCCGTHSYGCCGGMSYAAGCCGGSAYSCFGGPAMSYTPMFNGGLACQGGLPYSAPPPTFDTPGIPNVPYAVPTPAPGMIGLRPAAHAAAVPVSNGQTARATVSVRLPADAKLFAEGRALAQTGPERKFISPELPAEQEFVYQFRAEYERNGETVSVTKRVPVRAGAAVNVEFADLTAARHSNEVNGLTSSLSRGADVPARPAAREPAKAEPPVAPAKPTAAPTAPSRPAAERATITVKLPPGATLYVDDKKSPSAEPVRSFSTPRLPAGREFAYLLKAEVVRNGRPESLAQKVPFRAGERVIVDFTSLGQ